MVTLKTASGCGDGGRGNELAVHTGSDRNKVGILGYKLGMARIAEAWHGRCSARFRGCDGQNSEPRPQ